MSSISLRLLAYSGALMFLRFVGWHRCSWRWLKPQQKELQTSKSHWVTNTSRSLPAPGENSKMLRWLVIHTQLERQPGQRDTKEEETCIL